MTPVDQVVPARAMPRFPEFVAIIAGMMALTALSIDMMLPALDLIRGDLAVVGENDQQLVVTTYLLGFAFGQLFYGPLVGPLRPAAGAVRRARGSRRSAPSRRWPRTASSCSSSRAASRASPTPRRGWSRSRWCATSTAAGAWPR